VIHAFLIWQQPHPIFFAEMDYRAHPSEQTLEKWKDVVFATADFLASYPALDKDLLIMGALLHDIGKMEEIRLTQQVADRNSMPLIGHIALGVLWLEERAKKIDTLSETDRHALQHIQVSHHGELEYGSPLVPQIPEAMVVHFLDNLDARVTTALEQLNKAEPGGWTPYSKIHGTYLYRKE